MFKLISFISLIAFSDPLNAEYVVTQCGLKPLAVLLKSNDTEIVADTITILIQLKDYYSNTEIVSGELVKTISDIKKTNDRRLANLATVFLEDVCSTNKS